jgi:2-iminobutanoate/2-iminopropanoate deaminase
MSKKIVNTENAPRPVGPYSQAIQSEGILYLSGQIPLDPKTGNLVLDSFEAQCRQVLNNAKAVLEAGNSNLEQVLKVSIFLTDLARFEEFNRIYSEYFDQFKPARSCIH